MDWPLVWLLFCTYKRTSLALRGLELIRAHLYYPNLHIHICDDGSGETDDSLGKRHIETLANAIGGDVTWHEMSTPAGQFNLGGCANRGVEIGLQNGAEIFFVTCDDDAPLEPWDMRPHVDLLDTHPEVGAVRCVRLSEGLGLLLTSTRSERLNGQEYCWGRIIREWSINNPWQTQAYLNTFDMILYHKRYFDAYGLMPEYEHPGLTEVHYCSQYNYSPFGENGPQIWVPLGKGPGSPWWHVGRGQRAHHYLNVTKSTYRKEVE